ncbi:S41 family peptidase [Marinifilum sp.]|uniref:S41 family peptidase n=1 Tax=Marinifilum sp. TaxID=2033137 RepID=UPI003BAC35FB
MKLLRDIRDIVGVKGRECGDKSVEKLFAMSFWALYSETIKYEIQIPNSSQPISINAVTSDEYFKLRNKKYPPKQEQLYKLKLTKNNQVAEITIRSFYGDKNYISFLKKSFDTIKKENYKTLIIDVRNNPGGRSRAVDSLMNYLTSKPYSQYSAIRTRINIHTKEIFKNRQPNFFEQIEYLKKDTLHVTNSDQLIHYPDMNKQKYTGKLFVRINGRTNSAAATFSGIIKDSKLGIVVGSTSGEHIKYFGDFFTFKLPKTDFTFYVSSKELTQFGGSFQNQGVTPDIFLDENVNTIDYISGNQIW